MLKASRESWSSIDPDGESNGALYRESQKSTESTVIGARMSYRKWRENKQHLI